MLKNLWTKTKEIGNKIKKVTHQFVKFIFWFRYVLIFLFVTILAPWLVWKTSFEQYLELIKILIWPVSSIVLFAHFKKAFTYIFFSLRKFNLFGTANGELKNVEEVIADEVQKKVEEKEKAEKNQKEIEDIKRLRVTDKKASNKQLKDAYNLVDRAIKITESYHEMYLKSQEEVEQIRKQQSNSQNLFSSAGKTPLLDAVTKRQEKSNLLGKYPPSASK